MLDQTSLPPRLVVRSRCREQFTITYGDPYGRATGVEIRTPSPYAYKQTSASDLPGGQPTVDILDLDAGQLGKLVLACRTHTDGTVSSDATVGVCFDADRLDLGGVGIEPDSELMSTDAARKRARALGSG